MICGTASENQIATLTCPSGNVITAIDFASYGTPSGSCVNGFTKNIHCDATTSVSVVSSACLNRAACLVLSNNGAFGDPCGGTKKHLYIKATCGSPRPSAAPSSLGRLLQSPIDGEMLYDNDQYVVDKEHHAIPLVTAP